MERYGKLPLSFETNEGQTDPKVKFIARGPGYTLFLTPNESVLVLRRADGPLTSELGKDGSRGSRLEEDPVVAIQLVGVSPNAHVTGLDMLAGTSNYFIGNDPSKWRTKVPTYARVAYRGIYPGADLVYYGHQGQLEWDFVVAPGSDPARIRFKVGAGHGTRLRLASNGDLSVQAGEGEVRLRTPIVYQPLAKGNDRGPERTMVEGRYRLARNEVTFEIGQYDRRRPLVIDPVLSYSTYLGGNAIDRIYGIAVNSAGEATVVGPTSSINFPTANPYQAHYGGGKFDNFMAQLSADGTSLVFATYLGGSNDDECWGVGFDASQNVYVSGYTASPNFPVTPNAYRTSFNGTGSDAFLAKFNPTGSALLYSTYIAPIDPGQGVEPNGIFMAVNPSGKAYLVGPTTYSQFPVTPGAFQTKNLGNDDAFLTVIDTTQAGSASLAYSTFLGGSQHDVAQGVALDAGGNAYIIGTTHSSNFPVTSGAYQTACVLSGSGTCSGDVFLSKLNPGGHGSADLLYSTFMGGSAADEGVAVAVDASGQAYVTGETQSSDFPTTPGAFQTTCNSSGGNCEDGFIAKLNPASAGTADMVYSTFFGGTGTTLVKAVAADLAGDAYVAGRTTSTNFPLLRPIQSLHSADKGNYDGFVTELNPMGSGLVFSTYLGGNNFDSFNGVALDSSNSIYAGGRTQSTNYPATPGAFQTAHYSDNGSFDGIVAKVVPASSAGLALGPASLTFSTQLVGTTSPPQTMTLLAAGGQNLMITTIVANGTFGLTTKCGRTVAAGASCALNVTFTPTTAGPVIGNLTLTTNDPASPQTVSLAGTGTYVELIPGSLNFGSEPVGASGSPQTVTLTNTSSMPLAISGISVTGLDPVDFAEVNNCGTHVAPGSSCSVTITFTPAKKGTCTADLSISDNGGGSPQMVGLTGQGT